MSYQKTEGIFTPHRVLTLISYTHTKKNNQHLELCDPPGPLQYHLCPTRSATSYWNLDQHARTNLSTLLLPLLLAHTRTLFLILISSILDRVVKINTSSVVVSCLMIPLLQELASKRAVLMSEQISLLDEPNHSSCQTS